MGILNPNRGAGPRKNSESQRKRNQSIPQTLTRSLQNNKRHDLNKRRNIPPRRHRQKETRPNYPIQQKSRTQTRTSKSFLRKIPHQSSSKNPHHPRIRRSQRRKQKPRHRPTNNSPRSRVPRIKNETLHPPSTRQSLTKIRNTDTHRNRPQRKAHTRRRTII